MIVVVFRVVIENRERHTREALEKNAWPLIVKRLARKSKKKRNTRYGGEDKSLAFLGFSFFFGFSFSFSLSGRLHTSCRACAPRMDADKTACL